MQIIKIVLYEIRQKPFFAFLHLFGVAVTIAIVMLFVIKLESDFSPKGPEVNLDRTLYLWRTTFRHKDGDVTRSFISKEFLEKHFSKMKSFEHFSIFTEQNWAMPKRGKLQKFAIQQVDPDYFKINQFSFLEGKGISQQQFDNAEPVLVISRRVKELFFEDEIVVGKYFHYQRRDYRIIGVVENVPRSCRHAYADFWSPHSMDKTIGGGAEFSGMYSAIATVRHTDDIPKAKAEMASVLKRINAEYTDTGSLHINGPCTAFEKQHMTWETTFYPGDFSVWKEKFGHLFGILLIPILNIITLNITRTNGRSEEIAVRKTFGANHNNIIKQVLAENIFLTFMGAIVGFAIALILAYSIPNFIFDGFSLSGTKVPYAIQLNLGVFGVAMLVSLFFAVASGFFPAIKIAKLEPAKVLKGGKS